MRSSAHKLTLITGYILPTGLVRLNHWYLYYSYAFMSQPNPFFPFMMLPVCLHDITA